jgi:hypothetical protein
MGVLRYYSLLGLAVAVSVVQSGYFWVLCLPLCHVVNFAISLESIGHTRERRSYAGSINNTYMG